MSREMDLGHCYAKMTLEIKEPILRHKRVNEDGNPSDDADVDEEMDEEEEKEEEEEEEEEL
ncbi:MAG: hypothetical protein A2745_01130 [Candidatus Harrisonbacteria bacterium RIFCSPHIGHO2_01_FULL_44_13]|uniref:Uncharacterized protein n=1 Tax=Candidatus Harrisonbacteria bacterium RIFCSPLOWO2_01_FULL_44_18 TaxID=1798407 RepID=A0A1G1ZMG1_9BACT|nr:MAG: hypothetical protein A2745_01130 [Candidatus Harrisonbacteria bacterium RIFCSPHIGHO2_01_FULL_44_13]OGY65715.1 MAG: hypothetical protein A3A16_03835 [Candidatus Harrisonbacteria bacterium RIFCSPLOWO2_01_FULL_44_18]